ncbi:MAG: hypothetical protein N4A35_03300 [Flavobacteriales bacterium]|jgi:hypothetical protein|nr:hypothetical protein [Flavobacteriales bacterium]
MIFRLIAILSLFFLFSCDSSNKQQKVPSISNDLDTLSKIINLEKYKPVSAQWVYYPLGIENSSIPGPTDYQLEAVLYFEKETIEKLKTAVANDGGSSTDCSVDFKWLKHQELTHHQVCTNYTSSVFTKGALLHGNFIIEEDKVFLMMYSN